MCELDYKAKNDTDNNQEMNVTKTIKTSIDQSAGQCISNAGKEEKIT